MKRVLIFFSMLLVALGSYAGAGILTELGSVTDSLDNKYELYQFTSVSASTSTRSFFLEKRNSDGVVVWKVNLWVAKKGENGITIHLNSKGESILRTIEKDIFMTSRTSLEVSPNLIRIQIQLDRNGTPARVTAPTGNLYVLSIGIDNYSRSNITFQYAKSDALRLADSIVNQHKAKSDAKVHVRVFLDSTATFQSIDQAFRGITKTIKPSDYFVFFFAGLSVPFKSGDVSFYLYGADALAKGVDSLNNPRFNLLQLKNWLSLISAQRQLIITEAGSGLDFAKNLEKMIIGGDPIENVISRRNRVILTTNTDGIESNQLKGGPLAAFIMGLKEYNVFFLFEKTARDRVEFELRQQEVKAGIPGAKGFMFYTSVFYEAALIDQLQEFKTVLAPSKSRGEDEVPDPSKLPGLKRELVQNHALVIGIDDYDSPTWPDLTNPVNDAKAVESDLKNLYGFQTELLLNPTKQEINEALLRYYEKKYDTLKSQLLIFWAGHGGYDEFTSGFLVAKDSKSKSHDPLRDSYMEHSKLRNMLTNIKCPHIMLVLDACFGGTFDQKLSKALHRGELDRMYSPVVDEAFIHRKLKNQSRLYITSGGKMYVPDGRPGQHSPFARQFLDVLRNAGGPDRILTFSEIKSGIEHVNPEPCAGEFDGNEPGGDFLLMVTDR